jgi:hypothetical protein
MYKTANDAIAAGLEALKGTKIAAGLEALKGTK